MTASEACQAEAVNSAAASSEARSVIKVPAQRPFLANSSPIVSVTSPGKHFLKLVEKKIVFGVLLILSNSLIGIETKQLHFLDKIWLFRNEI